MRSPAARARLFTAFLAANLVMVVPQAAIAAGWGWIVPGDWIWQLTFDYEGLAANVYLGALWGAVAVLASAQLFRFPPASSARWLWVLGWLGATVFAALVAVEEVASLKDDVIGALATSTVLAGLKLDELPLGSRWLAVVAPLAIPWLAPAGWVFYTSQRGHPVRALLTALAVALGVGAVIRDMFVTSYGTTFFWELLIEEGSEVMAGAILAVILVEMLATQPGTLSDDRTRGVHGRYGPAIAMTVTAALLATSIFALFAEFQRHDEGWVRGGPRVYTGPVALIEQSFQADRDYLTRIEVWAFVDGGQGATAEIFARLTPAGSDRPIRESRAYVRHERFSHATVDFEFEPIPDSGGTSYDLAIGVLSGPEPYVFLGLTSGDLNPGSEVVISGAPSRYENKLAMGTYWVGRGGRVLEDLLTRDPPLLFLTTDVVATVFLWVFAVVAAGRGLSGCKPRFWRAFVRGAAQTSVLVTAGLATIAIALLTVLSSTPHG